MSDIITRNVKQGVYMRSIYNEDLYLKNYNKVSHFYEKLHDEMKNRCNNEKNNYSNLIDKYDEFILKVVELLKQLNIKSSIEYSLAISYLINEGYLSYDLKFIPLPTNMELINRFGISIISGRGCCRNISDMHNQIFKNLNLYNKKLYCSQKQTPFYNLKNKSANHVITVIEYEDVLYGIDLYNFNKLYRFKNSLILKEISIYYDNILRYKPYHELITSESVIDNIYKNIKLFELESKKNTLSALIYY